MNYNEIRNYVSSSVVQPFYTSRLASLNNIKLHPILRKKNPYLFRAKNVESGADLVKELLNAYISSGEETIFGSFLEQLAIFVCSKINRGWKSSTVGIDLEFEKDGVHYIVAIKSGPNWANSSQIEKMKSDFEKAKRTLRTNSSIRNIEAVNGCCYGIDDNPEKEGYIKLCGQRFWELVSGEEDFYIRIIEPLGIEAEQKDEQFSEAYNRKLNSLTQEFLNEFCANGQIRWNELVMFNSASKSP